MTGTWQGAQARVGDRGEKKLRRWLAEPEFQADHRAAREQGVRMAIGRVQGLLAKAAESMERATSSRAPTVELRAAVAVFEQVYKGPELLHLAERVAAPGSQKRGDAVSVRQRLQTLRETAGRPIARPSCRGA